MATECRRTAGIPIRANCRCLSDPKKICDCVTKSDQSYPEYMQRATVRAIKIREVVLQNSKQVMLIPEDHNLLPVKVSSWFYDTFRPHAGGYYVLIDGREQFSSSESFEKTYCLAMGNQ